MFYNSVVRYSPTTGQYLTGGTNVMGHWVGGSPINMPPMQQQAAPQQSMNPQGTKAFQDKLNRLTINASDALYGGLLGYNPKPIMSPTGNTYNPPAPTGGFRFPFGLLNGMGGQ